LDALLLKLRPFFSQICEGDGEGDRTGRNLGERKLKHKCEALVETHNPFVMFYFSQLCVCLS